MPAIRYTLSVLTAACVLALCQPAVACPATDRVAAQARAVAMALPAADRADALHWLRQWQIQTTPAAARQAPINRYLQAAHAVWPSPWLTSAPVQPCLPLHHMRPAAIDLFAPMALHIPSELVARWLAPWLDSQA